MLNLLHLVTISHLKKGNKQMNKQITAKTSHFGIFILVLQATARKGLLYLQRLLSFCHQQIQFSSLPDLHHSLCFLYWLFEYLSSLFLIMMKIISEMGFFLPCLKNHAQQLQQFLKHHICSDMIFAIGKTGNILKCTGEVWSSVFKDAMKIYVMVLKILPWNRGGIFAFLDSPWNSYKSQI